VPVFHYNLALQCAKKVPLAPWSHYVQPERKGQNFGHLICEKRQNVVLGSPGENPGKT